MLEEIVIKSFNGIGDLLFLTASLPKIKKFYPHTKLIVNTNYPELLQDNPYIDEIGSKNIGLFLGYPDPIHNRNPTTHHSISDYNIIKDYYNLKKLPPSLSEEERVPKVYFSIKKDPVLKIGVQTLHKGHWHQKKVWPFFDRLIRTNPQLFEAIPVCKNIRDLTNKIGNYKAVVCAEGGISHLAKALSIPAIVIYGGFANPEWNGYKDQTNLCNKLSCSYCYNSHICKSDKIDRECMRGITISYVLRQVEGLQKIPELERGNAKQFVETEALKFCRGRGIDVGAGKYPLLGADPVDLVYGHNAEHLNYSSDSLDYVFSSHCLEHIEDYKSVLKEMKRILKINGILFLYLPHPDYKPWKKEYLKWHKHNLYPDHIQQVLKELNFKRLVFIEKDWFFGHSHVSRKIE